MEQRDGVNGPPPLSNATPRLFAMAFFKFDLCHHSLMRPDCPSCLMGHAARMESQLGKSEPQLRAELQAAQEQVLVLRAEVQRAAAPPVAEGPAATPRSPIATDHCLQCGIHLAPEEELGGVCEPCRSGRKKVGSTSITFAPVQLHRDPDNPDHLMDDAQWKARTAAAEPPEARAAALLNKAAKLYCDYYDGRKNYSAENIAYELVAYIREALALLGGTK